MNSQLQKQILVGAVAGIVVAALIFLLLGGKRSDLAATQADIVQLQAAVDKGKLLKASYEKLREEVAKEDKRIDALVKIMPSEADYGEVPYRIKIASLTSQQEEHQRGHNEARHCTHQDLFLKLGVHGLPQAAFWSSKEMVNSREPFGRRWAPG